MDDWQKSSVQIPQGQVRCHARRASAPAALDRTCRACFIVFTSENRDGVPSSDTSIVSGCGSLAADATTRPGPTDCPSLPARSSLPSSRRNLEEDDALRAVDVD